MPINTYVEEAAELIGGFTQKRDEDYKQGFKVMMESMQGDYSLDGMSDISTILKNPAMREIYKEKVIGDVVHESFEDPYFNTHVQKLDQLFENSAFEILQESAVLGQLSPIVGTSLPILKKNYLDCVSKDIILTEVPTKPIVKRTFERKFLKDKEGNKYYIPEIFYDDTYKSVMEKSRGAAITSDFLPVQTSDTEHFDFGKTFPLYEYDLLARCGGALEKRDTISLDFAVAAVKLEVGKDSSDNPVIKTVTLTGCVPDLGNNNTFSQKVSYTDGTYTAEDHIFGRIDFYSGKVTVSSANGKVKQVQFSGHLSNENNIQTLELDREREVKTWQIGDGQKLNTGLTTEKLKDYKALLDIDIAAETVSDMSDVLTQSEDSSIIKFLRDSYLVWKDKLDLPFGYQGGFTAESTFSVTPPTTTTVPGSIWLNTELKFHLSRFIDRLKLKLNEQDIMIVIAGHPNHITLLDENVTWIIDDRTKMGGVQFNYNFGVLTDSKDRVQVVSSLKIPYSEGLMVMAYPLSDKTMTFKHYKYSMSIENGYRNPNAQLIPNIMATSRYLTAELLPVQGRFKFTNTDFQFTNWEDNNAEFNRG